MITYQCTTHTPEGKLLKGHGTVTLTGDFKAPRGLLLQCDPSWGTKTIWINDKGELVKEPQWIASESPEKESTR